MDTSNIKGVVITPLKQIQTAGGPIFHALKKTDSEFNNFGEAYFSFVEKGMIKAWKKHLRMTSNLIVPVGEVQFVLFDDRADSLTYKSKFEVILSPENYNRLTIPPGIIYGFKGLSESKNMVLNIADIPHTPDEGLKINLDQLNYEW